MLGEGGSEWECVNYCRMFIGSDGGQKRNVECSTDTRTTAAAKTKKKKKSILKQEKENLNEVQKECPIDRERRWMGRRDRPRGMLKTDRSSPAVRSRFAFDRSSNPSVAVSTDPTLAWSRPVSLDRRNHPSICTNSTVSSPRIQRVLSLFLSRWRRESHLNDGQLRTNITNTRFVFLAEKQLHGLGQGQKTISCSALLQILISQPFGQMIEIVTKRHSLHSWPFQRSLLPDLQGFAPIATITSNEKTPQCLGVDQIEDLDEKGDPDVNRKEKRTDLSEQLLNDRRFDGVHLTEFVIIVQLERRSRARGKREEASHLFQKILSGELRSFLVGVGERGDRIANGNGTGIEIFVFDDRRN